MHKYKIPDWLVALVFSSTGCLPVCAQAPSATTDNTYCPDYSRSDHYRARASQLLLSPQDNWQQAIARATPNTEILLQDGEYLMTRHSLLVKGNITIRSASGQPDHVLIKGRGYSKQAEGLMLGGNNITVAELSIAHMRNHAISIKNELGARQAPHIYGVHLYDIGTQHIKLTPGGTKEGLVACSAIGYSASGAVGDYNGAIDLHQAIDWHIRDNYIYNLFGDGSGCNVDTDCGSYDSAPAILVWQNAVGTITERNLIVDSFRGIAYGLGKGHSGGVIRDNIIARKKSGDAGIELQAATDVVVENNSVLLGDKYPGAIEYRGSSRLLIRNNTLSTRPFNRRNNKSITLENNIVRDD